MEPVPPPLEKRVRDVFLDSLTYTVVDSIKERKIDTDNLMRNIIANVIHNISLKYLIMGKFADLITDVQLQYIAEQYVARLAALLLAAQVSSGTKDILSLAKLQALYTVGLIAKEAIAPEYGPRRSGPAGSVAGCAPSGAARGL
jgi:hypothetical protein